MTVANGKISGTLKFIEGGLAETGPLAGDGYFLALKWTDPDVTATSLLVGLQPSAGSGLVEAIDDPDRDGVFKISSTSQRFKTITSNTGHKTIQTYDLSGLVFEDPAV